MKALNHLILPFTRILAVSAAALGLVAVNLAAQTIPNPSFETDNFTVFPGYISANTAITGWVGTPAARVGLNPSGGSPFADNGAIPDGAHVAFIQANVDDTNDPSRLTTTISGLTAGTVYKLTFRANARNGQQPILRVQINATDLLGPGGTLPRALNVYSVGGLNPYPYIAYEFTAAGSTAELALINDSPVDATVLVDDFKVAPSSGRWTVTQWMDDTSMDANFYYTHAYNLGDTTTLDINGVAFTGIPGANPSVAGRFTTEYLGQVPVDDARAFNVWGTGSYELADAFCYGGTIPAGTFQTISLEGLTPGTEYLFTIYSIAWEAPTTSARWMTFNVGEDRLTLNQDEFGDLNGIQISYRYVATAATAAIKFAPINPVNVSFHVYAFSNRELVSRNVAPTIQIQPRSLTVSEGLSATFAVSGSGLPAPTYQWRFNGQNIDGAVSPTYTIDATTPTNAGIYSVVLNNIAGSITSAPVKLTLGVPMDNPSFETDTYTIWPGYADANGPITFWASLNNHGINPIADNRSPFADNGIIPHGKQVAFMQGDGGMTNIVNGLTPGALYYVHYFENARSGPTLPGLELKVAGTSVVPPHIVTIVGGANPYHEIYSDLFSAASAATQLEFVKSNPQGGDTTVLVDNAAVVRLPDSSAPFVSWQPAPRLISVGESTSLFAAGIGTPPLSYQWLRDGNVIPGATERTLNFSGAQKLDEAGYSLRINNAFGAVTSAVARVTVFEPIPGLFNTGVDNNRLALADGTVDPHYTLIANADSSSTNAIVEDGSVFPIAAGPWLANTPISKWIGPSLNTSASAVGQYIYRTILDLTGRDPSTVYIEGRWATDNQGADIRVNGITAPNPQNNSFAAYTGFTIYGTNVNFTAGPNTLDFVVNNLTDPGYTGLRVEIIRSNVRIPPGVVPSVTGAPASQDAIQGDPVSFTVGATGTAPITYQWRKNGVALPGKTDLTFTIPSVSTNDIGAYDVAITNAYGWVFSPAANLTVTWRRMPAGIFFGTGVALDGTLVPGGGVDPHYLLIASIDPVSPGPDAIVLNDVWPVATGVWLPNGPNSKWIAPALDQSVGSAPGQYTYQTKFDLTGYDASQVRVAGAVGVDNSVTVVLNGQPTTVAVAGFNALTPFTIDGGLQAGLNTLDFVVENATGTGQNPTGLRLDLGGLVRIAPITTGPTLKVDRAANNIVISWTPTAAGQKLQVASDVTGSWNEIQGATSPFTTNTTSGMLFFRVQQ